jgi:hypothetical protein
MKRDVLHTVWWPPSNHVYGSECNAPYCGRHVYPIKILLNCSGYRGSFRERPDGTKYGFNFRFCSEQCMEDFKAYRMEVLWASAS